MHNRMPMPWWRIATIALLAVALGVALSQGRPWDAAIIAVLLVPGVALVVAALYFRWKPPGPKGTDD